jgi:hypothetical protein
MKRIFNLLGAAFILLVILLAAFLAAALPGCTFSSGSW